MAAPDISSIADFLPILSFLLVFIVVFAALAKTGILGKSKWVNLLVSFITATIFVSLTSAREFILNITPWFAVFLILAVFVLVIAGFGWKIPEGFTKGAGIILVLAFVVLFLVSAYMTFSGVPIIEQITDWVKTPRIYGALLLVVVSVIVSFILTRK